jgi:hypothetical protein
MLTAGTRHFDRVLVDERIPAPVLSHPLIMAQPGLDARTEHAALR